MDKNLKGTETIRKNEPGAGEIFLQELSRKPAQEPVFEAMEFHPDPFLAIISGLFLGAVIIILSSSSVYAGFGQGLGEGFKAMWSVVSKAYSALFSGAFGSPSRMIEALRSGERIGRAFKPITQSLVETTPYLLSGLAVALGFRAGVFNIGGEGQIYIGAIIATFVGLNLHGLPQVLHVTIAMLAGMAGGALWGFVPAG